MNNTTPSLLKTGNIYKLKVKENPLLLNNQLLSDIDKNDLSLNWTFLGKLFCNEGGFNRINKSIEHSVHCFSYYIFLVNNQLIKIKERNFFELIEFVGTDSNYEDIDLIIKKFNENVFREFKYKYDDMEIPFIKFSICLDSQLECDLLTQQDHNLTLIKLKELVGIS